MKFCDAARMLLKTGIRSFLNGRSSSSAWEGWPYQHQSMRDRLKLYLSLIKRSLFLLCRSTMLSTTTLDIWHVYGHYYRIFPLFHKKFISHKSNILANNFCSSPHWIALYQFSMTDCLVDLHKGNKALLNFKIKLQ